MPSFSRSIQNRKKKIVQVKLQSPMGKIFSADVFSTENIGDLMADFYEFLGISNEIPNAKAYLVDVDAPSSIIGTLDMYSTVEDSGIVDNTQILFATEYGYFDIEFAIDKTLRISMPFPPNLPVTQFMNYSNDFFIAAEILYSLFAIILSTDKLGIMALRRLLAEDPQRLAEMQIVHQILQISKSRTLELERIHYGSPYSLSLDGLWKPLEMLGDVIKGARWKWDYEEQSAELDLKERHLKLAQMKLDMAIQIADLNIPDEEKTKIIDVVMLPGIEKLVEVIEISREEHNRQLSKKSIKNARKRKG